MNHFYIPAGCFIPTSSEFAMTRTYFENEGGGLKPSAIYISQSPSSLRGAKRRSKLKATKQTESDEAN